MAEYAPSGSLTANPRFRMALGFVGLVIVAVGLWLWRTAGNESTDDAQVDAHVTQIAARVGGTVQRVAVKDNQRVEAGALLVELDPRDYEVAVARARAALADAEATAVAAQSGVPITSTTTTSNLSTAQQGVAQAAGGVAVALREVDVARARVATAEARLREFEANAIRTARDVERLRALLAKDEVSQQQFDAAVAAADALKAGADSARAQIAEAQAGIPVAESRLVQARAAEQQAHAALRTARTAPELITQIKARADAAEAQVQQAEALLEQAELNRQYAIVKAPVAGLVSKKTVETGQVVQPGQPLMALIALDDVWVTANFKETQLRRMRPGQPATIKVDAYGGLALKGHVDSIAAATGARFSLLPPENATGNYVKVVQRIPVKLVLDQRQDPEHLLRPGMSVVPTVHTN